jgi:hypothetical protein
MVTPPAGVFSLQDDTDCYNYLTGKTSDSFPVQILSRATSEKACRGIQSGKK